MPVKARSSGLWDIQVNIQGEGEIERVSSLNHPVAVKLTENKTGAIVNLKPTVDRSFVPTSDFVLLVRDKAISQPSAISTLTNSGKQVINFKMLPDSRADSVKQRVME